MKNVPELCPFQEKLRLLQIGDITGSTNVPTNISSPDTMAALIFLPSGNLKQDEPDPVVIAGSDDNLISGNLTGGKSGYSPVRWQDLLQDQRP